MAALYLQREYILSCGRHQGSSKCLLQTGTCKSLMVPDRAMLRLTEQIKQHLVRLGESGPWKKCWEPGELEGQKWQKNQKSKKSNRHDQNVGKVKYIGKTRLKIQNHPIFGQNHKDFMFLWILDPKNALYGALFGPIGPYLPGLGK